MSQPDLDFPLGSETPSLDDSIISDVSLLEIDTEQIIESDVERDFRVSSIIKGSLTGAELLNNIEKHCPRTGAKFGKTLVMNRCVKYFISVNKLSKSSFNYGWRSTSEESRNTVKELFNCITRDTDECLRPPEIKGMITTPLKRCFCAFEDFQYASLPHCLAHRDPHHDSVSDAVVPMFHLSLLISSQEYVE